MHAIYWIRKNAIGKRRQGGDVEEIRLIISPENKNCRISGIHHILALEMHLCIAYAKWWLNIRTTTGIMPSSLLQIFLEECWKDEEEKEEEAAKQASICSHWITSVPIKDVPSIAAHLPSAFNGYAEGPLCRFRKAFSEDVYESNGGLFMKLSRLKLLIYASLWRFDAILIRETICNSNADFMAVFYRMFDDI